MIAVLIGAVVLLTSGSPSGAEGSDPRADVAAMDSTERQAAVELTLTEARNLLNAGEAEKAVLLLEETTKRFPDQQSLHHLLADAHFSADDPLAAYESMDASIGLGEPHPEHHFAAAVYADEAGLLDEALKHLLKAQSLGASSVKYPVYLASLRVKRGEPQEAKQALLRAINIDEGVPQAWGMLAQIAFDENNLSLARQHIGKARALEPDVPAYRVLEARILRRDMQPEQAANVLLGIPERQRLADPNIVDDLATCFRMLGETARAAAVYAAAAEYNPEDAAMAFKAAELLAEVGETRRALRYADRAEFLGYEGAAALADRLADEELGPRG
jgi:tetratricopeptide (TPR) repeat protein